MAELEYPKPQRRSKRLAKKNLLGDKAEEEEMRKLDQSFESRVRDVPIAAIYEGHVDDDAEGAAPPRKRQRRGSTAGTRGGRGGGRGRGRGRGRKKQQEVEEEEEEQDKETMQVDKEEEEEKPAAAAEAGGEAGGEAGETAAATTSTDEGQQKSEEAAPQTQQQPQEETQKEDEKGEEPAKEEKGKEEEEEEQPQAKSQQQGAEEDHEHKQLAQDEDLEPSRLLARSIVNDQPASQQTATILEKGKVYFFYRPSVNLGGEGVHDYHDVARFFMLLDPKENETSTDPRLINRLIVIGRKKLPEVDKHERYWAFVEKATEDIKEIDAMLGKDKYQTTTLGEREVPVCRPAGEGYYGIVNHHGHTHLAYVLEEPTAMGDVQKAFNILKEASYVISIKNPKVAGGFTGAVHKAQYPEVLQDAFKDRRWLPLVPPAFLNYEGAEMVIVGTSDDLVGEFGEAGEELEKDEQRDVARGGSNEVAASRYRLFNDLKLTRKQLNEMPLKPLTEGTWQ